MYRIHSNRIAVFLAFALAACGEPNATGPEFDLDLDGLAPSMVLLATETASYLDVTASITAPDPAESDTDFALTVSGEIAGGSAFSVHAFSIYEDAAWSYNASHMVSVSSGLLLAADGFGWGNTLLSSVVLNKPAGTYRYTFIFGARSGGHGWYDVAVDLDVTVGEAGPTLCVIGWLPPLTDVGRAGRTVPLKFVASVCDGGAFYRDEGVVVSITDSTGSEVGSWSFTGNPHTGVQIGDEAYHMNWTTDGSADGTHVITVHFSTGGTLVRTITLG